MKKKVHNTSKGREVGLDQKCYGDMAIHARGSNNLSSQYQLPTDEKLMVELE